MTLRQPRTTPSDSTPDGDREPISELTAFGVWVQFEVDGGWPGWVEMGGLLGMAQQEEGTWLVLDGHGGTDQAYLMNGTANDLLARFSRVVTAASTAAHTAKDRP